MDPVIVFFGPKAPSRWIRALSIREPKRGDIAIVITHRKASTDVFLQSGGQHVFDKAWPIGPYSELPTQPFGKAQRLLSITRIDQEQERSMGLDSPCLVACSNRLF